jgi:hypothetical protein
MNSKPTTDLNDMVLKDMQNWLERAVIGLNLCPFAKGVHVKGQIHYVVSLATEPQSLLQDLRRELRGLELSHPSTHDTTLLMAPMCLQDFLDFNDFLGQADQALTELDLDSVIQIASFHPQFQFAGTRPDDISNFTNRAPYPTLHLLREESIERAIEAYPQAEAIYGKNMETLKKLGQSGWAALGVDRSDPASVGVDGLADGKDKWQP